MTTHESRIHYKLDEIGDDLAELADANNALNTAMDACDNVLADLRVKLLKVIARRQEIAADIAILREMMGIR